MGDTVMAFSTANSPRNFAVVIADPDARVRMRLSTLLASDHLAPSFDTIEAASIYTGELESPSVLVAGPGFANALGMEHLQRFLLDHPNSSSVLVSEELTTQILQQALRAGARDVLTMGTIDSQLAVAVGRVGELLAATNAHYVQSAALNESEPGRLIVSFSTKGGVGKSTIATNMATGLALRDPGRVVIVDGDLQFGDVAVLLGIPPQYSILDAVALVSQNETDLNPVLGRHEASGLRVLAAPVEPAAADTIRPQNMLDVCRALQQHFDFVVVDMPPHFDDTVLALIDHADHVMLIASMDIPSIKNLKVGMQTLDILSIAGEKLHLVLNRANAKVKLDVDQVEKALGVPAEFPIPSDIAVPQAVNRGIPVILDNPRSNVARAIEQMVAKMFALGKPELAEQQSEAATASSPRRFFRRG